MRTKPILWLLFALLALVEVGCGDNKNPETLKIDPASFSVGIGGTVSVTARLGATPPTELEWTSSDTAVARVTPGSDGTATVRGIAPGTATITAAAEGQTATAAVTVNAAVLTSIAITPPSPMIAAGTSTALTATGTMSDGTTTDLTSTVTWSSATATVATVSPTGQLTGVAAGTSVITATSGTVSGTTTATISAANLLAIDITPVDPTLVRGTTQQLTATGRYSDTTTQNLTALVTWSSGTATVATVSTGGLVSAVTVGNAVVTATMGAVTGNVTVHVTAATLTSIDVTPPNPSIADGLTQQFTATGHFSDTTTQNLTSMVTWTSGTPANATIVAGGLATAVNPGTSTITATLGAISGSTTLTVTTATLVSIAVTPPAPSIARGLTQQFTATGTFTDLTTSNLTQTVTWTSGTPATATISNAAGTRGLATSAAVGTTLITAAMGPISGSTTLTVTPATLVSIAVTPPNPSIARGLIQQLTATGTFTDLSTSNLTATVTWTSGTPATATISNAAGSQGLATSAAVGTTQITAAMGPISGSTTLTVTPATLVSIAVTPPNPSIARGLIQQLTATGTFTDLSTSNLTATVTWTSGTPATATISNAAGSQGLATSAAVGTTLITATSGAISGSTTLTVTPATLVSIQVTPINPTISAGTTQQFTATGTFTDLSTSNLTATATWSSGTPTVATISSAAGSQGVATTVAAGTSVITATSGAISGSTTLTVTNAVLVSIVVTPANSTLVVGLDRPFVATGVYSDATTGVITDAVTWTSSDATVASISNADGSRGVATALAAGATTITATQGAVSGSTGLTVSAVTLVSITIAPVDVSIANGRTQQFLATGHYSDLSTQPLTTSVTWASTLTTVAQISNAAGSEGLATSTGLGVTSITATSGSVVGTTTLTVTDAVLESITVTPADLTIGNGLTQPYVATGHFSDLTTPNLTATVTWSSTLTTVAQISNAAGSEGLATATGLGVTTITATSGAISGSTSLTVGAAVLVSIAVTPSAPTINSGATVQLTATGTFSDLSTSNVTATASWSSLATATATVNAAGLVTGVAAGTVEIRATSGTVFGAASVTVVNPPPVVVATAPVDGTLGARTAAPVSFVFSLAMDPTSLVGQTATGPCTGTLQLSADNFATCLGFTTAAPVMTVTNTVATLQPAAVLGVLGSYKLRVDATVRSALMVALGATFTQPTGFRVATDGPCAAHVVISQVYGAGGNAGATLNADFVELHNPFRVPVSIAGMAIQYASSAGVSWQPTPLPNVSIPPGGYFTVRISATGGTGAVFTADFIAAPSIAMAAAAGKVALTATTQQLPGVACPLSSTVDFVAFGTGTNCQEGGTATPAPSTTLSVFRAAAGCTDANVNSTDFATGAVAPRNAATAPLQCACSVTDSAGAGLVSEADYCILQFPPTMSVPATNATPFVFTRIFEAGITEAAGANAGVVADIGFGPTAVNPVTTMTGYTWTPATFNVQVGNDDEYQASFTAPATGTYGYTGRVSRDGTNFTVCDLNGVGTNGGFVFDLGMLGILTVP